MDRPSPRPCPLSAGAADSVAWLRQLCAALAVPGLATYGTTEADVPELVEKAKRASSTRGDPIKLTDEELTEIAPAVAVTRPRSPGRIRGAGLAESVFSSDGRWLIGGLKGSVHQATSDSITWLSLSAGVSHSRVCRGRRFRRAATASISDCV